MRVIPVIDLLGGQVVRGVGGRRHAYRPIRSQLCPNAQPRSVARAFASLGFRELYVAHLDAIEKGELLLFDEKAECLLFDLLQSGMELWLDAGLRSTDAARAVARLEAGGRRVAGVVAGLESLPDAPALEAMCRAVGPDRLVFSLDLKREAPIAGPGWHGLSSEQIATIALRSGVRRMIVLDLASVGMGRGVGTEPLCRALRSLDDGLQIVAGGGVRGPGDLDSLARAGCDAALVASALHDGRLDPRSCAQTR